MISDLIKVNFHTEKVTIFILPVVFERTNELSHF